jgi:hypothetical protein
MTTKKFIKKTYFTIKWCFSIFLISFSDIGELSEQNILERNALRKILILVPHADDEWIGCSQILKKSADKSVYYFNFLGDNYSSENEKIRLDELKSLQNEIGFNLFVSSHNNYEDLKNLIHDNDFSGIFIPCPIDWHPEHILVNKIFKNIFPLLENNNINLYFYKVSVPLPAKMNKVFLPMSKENIKEKQNIFKKHYPSQKNVSIVRLTLQNRLSKGSTNHYAIEPYGKIEISTWHKLLDYIDQNFIEKFQPMKHAIDSPIKIRKLSNIVYEEFLTQKMNVF